MCDEIITFTKCKWRSYLKTLPTSIRLNSGSKYSNRAPPSIRMKNVCMSVKHIIALPIHFIKIHNNNKH